MQRGWVVSPHYRAAIDAIKTTRQQMGLSQRELARRLGKPPSFVNKIEVLERRLDVVEFIALANAMGVVPEKFLKTVRDAMPGEPEI
jgi:transcriptional regulator with XRE-family HTH domain